jgi:hypothetical protein
MEPVSLLVSLVIAIGTGALSKVGENITDGTVNLSRSLWSILSRKAPDSQTARLIEAGQEIDYQQAVIDVEAIADDPDVVRLLDQVRSLLASNQELAAKVEALQKQLKSGDTISIGKQINVDQSGNSNTQHNTFNL